MAIFLGLVQFRQTSPNVWYHIALVRDNGIFKLFVNGILKGSAGYNIDLDYFSNMPFEIGVGVTVLVTVGVTVGVTCGVADGVGEGCGS